MACPGTTTQQPRSKCYQPLCGPFLTAQVSVCEVRLRGLNICSFSLLHHSVHLSVHRSVYHLATRLAVLSSIHLFPPSFHPSPTCPSILSTDLTIRSSFLSTHPPPFAHPFPHSPSTHTSTHLAYVCWAFTMCQAPVTPHWTMLTYPHGRGYVAF